MGDCVTLLAAEQLVPQVAATHNVWRASNATTPEKIHILSMVRPRRARMHGGGCTPEHASGRRVCGGGKHDEGTLCFASKHGSIAQARSIAATIGFVALAIPHVSLGREKIGRALNAQELRSRNHPLLIRWLKRSVSRSSQALGTLSKIQPCPQEAQWPGYPARLAESACLVHPAYGTEVVVVEANCLAHADVGPTPGKRGGMKEMRVKPRLVE